MKYKPLPKAIVTFTFVGDKTGVSLTEINCHGDPPYTVYWKRMYELIRDICDQQIKAREE